MYPHASPEALDLLDRMLAFNPAHRIDVEDALRSPFCAQYFEPADEPRCPAPFTFEFELDDLPKERLKELIYEEIQLFHAAQAQALVELPEGYGF